MLNRGVELQAEVLAMLVFIAGMFCGAGLVRFWQWICESDE